MGDGPFIIESASDAAAIFTIERVKRGWTGEVLDAVAGLSDRYSAKLEQPTKAWGKKGLHISPMWEILAMALGYRLVLMKVEQAEAIGAIPAPRRPPVRKDHIIQAERDAAA